MIQNYLKHLALLVFCLLLLVSGGSPSRAQSFDAVAENIRAALVDEQVPSFAVAVARDGKILWEQAFGWADRENRRPATEHTMYSLASISKPITATGLMILVERGKLDLDRPANDYLGAAKLVAHVGQVEKATLRRLASHTSGLPLHYQFFYEDEPYSKPSADESIRRYGQLVTAPGEAYQYANFGYGVLDYVISRTSGMEYAEFMRREVFLPLGMTRTSVGIGTNLGAYQAVRYGADQTPIPFYDFDHPGASAVYSSAHDLVRFGMFHLKQLQPGQKAILSHSAIDEMQRPLADVGGGRGYGLGWFINPDEHGRHTISHSGGMGGVRTRLTLVPQENIVVAALANARTSLPQRMTGEILAMLLPDYGKKLRAANRKETSREGAKVNFRPPDSLVGDWQGDVHTHLGGRSLQMQIKPTGDIHIQLAGQLKTLLNDLRFQNERLTGVFAGDIGAPDANRRPYHLHLRAKLRHDTLNGSLTAISLPGRRAGNALSYWVELRRRGEAKAKP